MIDIAQVQVSRGVFLRARLSDRPALNFALEYTENGQSKTMPVDAVQADLLLRMREKPWTAADQDQADGLANVGR